MQTLMIRQDTPETNRRIFYCPDAAQAGEGGDAALSSNESHHALRVLRMAESAPVRLFDGCGSFFDGEITDARKHCVTVRIDRAFASETEPRTRVTLLTGLLKGRKADFLIQKSVEIGVGAIHFFPADRSVARKRRTKDEKRTSDRWEKIVVSACKQCGRATLMPVRFHASLAEAIAAVPEEGGRLVFWEALAEPPSSETQETDAPPRFPDGVCALIGPEGGLTAEEVERVQQAGFRTASLGPRILRAETAALTAATILLAAGGDLGALPPLTSPSAVER
jgi:16S rRNA (uracil1498-N3)-methyltransferase